MAVIQKPNENYWALKERLETWGNRATIINPLIALPTLGFGGAFIGGQLFPTHGFILGFVIGGIFAQAVCLTYWKRKLGFLMFSNARCQNCKEPLAQWHLNRIRLDNICLQCGNDNRIDLHDS